VIVYRLHSSKYPPNDGQGAYLAGGRWNSPGRRAIYTANSRALAVLEILVNFTLLPRDYVMTPVEIPEEVTIRHLRPSFLVSASVPSYSPEGHLPPGQMDIKSSRALGDNLLTRFAVLRVPSVVVPEEYNYVINPEHPDFRFIKFLEPVQFQFDMRLK